MKTASVLVSLSLAFASSTFAEVWMLNIQALIDGRDQLIIQGNTLQWHHFDYAAVGRHEGANEPTVITTTHDGLLVMDQVAWTPDWPALPPDEIRYEAWSSTFTSLAPTMPQRDTYLRMELVQARNLVSLIQFPTAANGYTTILEFDDNNWGASAIYEARLVFDTTVPEPTALTLVALGGFAASRLRRNPKL